MEIATEFQLVEQALSQLLSNNQRGLGDSLVAAIFRREPVMRELAQVLGMKPMEWRELAVPITATKIPATKKPDFKGPDDFFDGLFEIGSGRCRQ